MERKAQTGFPLPFCVTFRGSDKICYGRMPAGICIVTPGPIGRPA
jgi:hypothetical protein